MTEESRRYGNKYIERSAVVTSDTYTGVCNNCRAVVPFDCDSTHRHHEEYHQEDALKDTIELCPICHTLFDRERRKRIGKNVSEMLLIDEIKQMAKHYERLYYTGEYKYPINTICATICSDLRRAERYSAISSVHLALEPKYKQIVFRPKRKLGNRNTNGLSSSRMDHKAMVDLLVDWIEVSIKR